MKAAVAKLILFISFNWPTANSIIINETYDRFIGFGSEMTVYSHVLLTTANFLAKQRQNGRKGIVCQKNVNIFKADSNSSR